MFMVVETFCNQDAKAIYRRSRERGRMMPDGLKFVSSRRACTEGAAYGWQRADADVGSDGSNAQVLTHPKADTTLFPPPTHAAGG
jgi:hypothetical protein